MRATIEGRATVVVGMRNVAVDVAWRGRGLSSSLVGRVRAWAERTEASFVLLYTDRPELYENHGFWQRPLYAFEGPPPVVATSPPLARRFDRRAERARLESLLVRRSPLSAICALRDGPGLFLAALPALTGFRLAYVEADDALIAFRETARRLVVADVVAAEPPPMSRIVGALAAGGLLKRGAPATIRTLFPPDRLAWTGTPQPYDSGLMVSGDSAADVSRFSFPPTSEF